MTMLPRLQAREQMRVSEAIAMGTGSYKEDTIKAVAKRWDAQAAIVTRRAPRRPVTPMEMAEAGIKVIRRAKR